MRILFAISVVALMALLWASVSTAQYIRRARNRRKLLQEFALERASRLAEPPSGFAPVKIVAVHESILERQATPEPLPTAVAPPPSAEEALAVPPPPFPELRPTPEPTLVAEVIVEPTTERTTEQSEARWPLARHRQSSAAVPIHIEPEPEATAIPAPTPEKPFLKRPPSSVTPQLRPDWAYYNEDMGDLSDPNPRSSRIQRFKQRFRPS